MFVDRSVLFDIGIGGRHIGFRLVIVVIGDEIFHGVLREKRFHLPIQLRCQGFIGGQHQRRTLHGGHDVGHGEGLAAARHAQQGLMGQAVMETLNQATNRLRLVASGFKGRVKDKRLGCLHGVLVK